MSHRTDLKVGFACNNRCVFCAQGEKRGEVGVIRPEELVQRMRLAFRPGRGLVLTGGEPTLHKHLVALVRTASRIGYAPIQLQTNGRMLSYRPLVEALVAAGLGEISPALHGPTAEVHEALTRAPGSFAQTVAGIENALGAGVPVITNTVVVRHNLAHLTPTVQLLATLGVQQAQLALVHPVGTAAGRFDEVVPRISAAAAAMKDAVRAGRKLGMRVVTEAVPPCFMRELPDAVVEDRIPETTVVDLDGDPFDFSTWRRGEGKAKGPPCERCSRSDSCEGPWRELPERHGWDEYIPF